MYGYYDSNENNNRLWLATNLSRYYEDKPTSQAKFKNLKKLFFLDNPKLEIQSELS